MEYRNVDGQLEVVETVVNTVRHDIKVLRERKRIMQEQIDFFQAEKAKVQALIDQAKLVNIE